MHDDNTYIEQVLAGNTTAFAVLVERHKNLVFSIVVKIVRQQQDAEDLAQEVFVKAFSSLSSFRHNARFSTWLCRIAYNTAISHIRKKRPDKAKDTVEIEEVALLPASTDANEALEDRLKQLKNSVSKLTTEDEVLLSLYYQHEKSMEEIASITSLSVSNVKVRLHRIRKKLFEYMKEEQ